MYAKIVTWLLADEIQSPDAYDRFLRSLAERNTPILRRYGLLDGFAIRLNHRTMMTMNLYESKEQAEAAWEHVIVRLNEDLDGQVTVIDRKDGSALDLPLLLGEG